MVCAFEFGIEYTTGRANLQHTALGAIKGFLAVSLFTILPVSYTHLDVYKRQSARWTRMTPPQVLPALSFGSTV